MPSTSFSAVPKLPCSYSFICTICPWIKMATLGLSELVMDSSLFESHQKANCKNCSSPTLFLDGLLWGVFGKMTFLLRSSFQITLNSNELWGCCSTTTFDNVEALFNGLLFFEVSKRLLNWSQDADQIRAFTKQTSILSDVSFESYAK